MGMRNPLSSKFFFVLMSAVDVRMFYRLATMDATIAEYATGGAIERLSIHPAGDGAPIDSVSAKLFLEKVARDLSCRLELIEIWRIPPGTHMAEAPSRTYPQPARHRYHLVLYGPIPATIEVGTEQMTAHQGEIFWTGTPANTSIRNDGPSSHIHVVFDLTREAK